MFRSNLSVNITSHASDKRGGADKEGSPAEVRLYKRRWFILGMFMTYAIAAGMQWMQYSIITSVITKYYQVEPYVVEWTTMLHMLAYVLCIFPALLLLDKAVSGYVKSLIVVINIFSRLCSIMMKITTQKKMAHRYLRSYYIAWVNRKIYKNFINPVAVCLCSRLTASKMLQISHGQKT